MRKKLFLSAFIAIICGCAAAPDNPLSGTVWRPESSPAGARLEITQDNRLVGRTPDNHFFAPVSFAPPSGISFAPVAVTRRAGENGDFERNFLEALNQTTGYRLENSRLILLNAAGRELMRCEYLGRAGGVSGEKRGEK